jgi:hypothetical protein
LNEEAMRSPLSVLREGALQALREAVGEMTNAGWSVAVENHTLALVGVSEVPMGRNMLFLDSRFRTGARKISAARLRVTTRTFRMRWMRSP